MPNQRSIMCYGDSLTWGWIPVESSAPTTRYPAQQRWTGVMAEALGEGYRVIEEGLNSRTTDVEDPLDARVNGNAYLPSALASHLPLDLVVLMLGTNDTKYCFRRTANDITNGMHRLIVHVLTSAGGIGTIYPAPKVLVIAPPPLADMPDPYFRAMFEGAHEKSAALSGCYSILASFFRVDFLDAGAVIATDGMDGIHLSGDANRALGQAVAEKVRGIFAAE